MEEKEYVTEEMINDESNEMSETDKKIYQLDIRAQELEILIDQLEEIAMQNDEDVYDNDQYLEYKEEYKKIVKERKQIKKDIINQDTSSLNQVSIWVLIYGTLMLIISFPIITGTLWLDFANIVINLLAESFAGLNSGDFIYNVVLFIVIFSLPLLINLVTWLIYVNLINKKADKKIYIGFWIAQGILSLIMIIYMCTQLYGA